jgi:hypothetical protein
VDKQEKTKTETEFCSLTLQTHLKNQNVNEKQGTKSTDKAKENSRKDGKFWKELIFIFPLHYLANKLVYKAVTLHNIREFYIAIQNLSQHNFKVLCFIKENNE